MIAAPIPPHESARLAALHRYQILDTSSESAFDELARLAAYVCRTPVAVISLVDFSRQWFKSVIGLPYTESPRSLAFCAHTILGADLFIVEEVDADERFADHPWVLSSPGVRFYAGAPLITGDGHAIGSLAVMDVVSRVLTPEQHAAMETLAAQIMAQCELRRRRIVPSREEPNLAWGGRKVEDDAHRWQQVFDQTEFGLAYGDIETNTFVTVNPAFARQLGYDVHELIGQPLTMVYAPEERAAMAAQFPVIDRTGHLVYESRHIRKDGTTFPVLMEVTVIKDAHGRPVSRVAYAADITERKRTEEALQASRERLQQALQASNTGLWEWNTESGEVSFSKEWKSQLGYGESELSDSFETWVARLHPDDRDRAILYAQQYRDNPLGEFRQDFRLRHKDGSYRWFDSHASFVTEPDGRRIRLLGSHTDITERKQAEEAVRRSEARLQFALETGHIGAWDLDLVTHQAHRSLEHDRIFGYPALLAEWSYERFLDHVLPDDRELVDEKFRQATADRVDWSFECRIRRTDGEVRWIWAAGRHQVDADGAVRRMAGIVQDVTERKWLDNALREREMQLRMALDAAGEGTFDYDFSTNRTTFSARGLDLFGFSPDYSPLYDDWLACIHPEDRAEVAARFERALRDHADYQAEYRVLRPDGGIRWVVAKGRAVYSASGKLVRAVGVLMDTTERKQSENALQESEARFRQMADTIRAVFWMTDPAQTRVYYVSQAFEDIWGRPCAVLYASPMAWLEAIHPDDKARVQRSIETDQTSGRYEEIYRIIRPDATVRWIHDRAFPVRDDCGSVEHIVGIAQDITERKRAEQLRDGQRAVLELIAKGAPLSVTLARVCEVVEAQSDGVLCSILIKDGERLRHAAGSTLPAEYVHAIDGIRIGPAAGSCGTAVYRNHAVRVDDIASDPLWEKFREVGLRHGIHACWSTPIRDAQGAPLGTFALYHRMGTAFTPQEYEWVETGASLSGIAIDRDRSEHALRDSEERFRLVAEATNDILWDWDLVTQDHWWSPNARAKFGYDPKAEPSITAWMSRLHPDDRGRVLELVDRALASDARTVVAEYRFRLADGSFGYFYDRGQIIRDSTGRAIRMIGAMIDVTFTKRAYATLEEAYQRLQGMSRELQAVETNERRRLSRELHDEVGQLLTALKFDLEASRQALSDKPAEEFGRVYERTVRALETTDELFVRLRRVVRALRPSVLDELGLKDALEAMVSDIQSRSDLVCSVSVEGEVAEDPATSAIEAALYRMAQELVTNVVRHAQAMTLSVALERDASQWMLMVQDDGVGFNSKAESISGMGIRGVRERAEILGGHVDVNSLPGAGTSITVRIPVQSRVVFDDGGNGNEI